MLKSNLKVGFWHSEMICIRCVVRLIMVGCRVVYFMPKVTVEGRFWAPTSIQSFLDSQNTVLCNHKHRA